MHRSASLRLSICVLVLAGCSRFGYRRTAPTPVDGPLTPGSFDARHGDGRDGRADAARDRAGQLDPDHAVPYEIDLRFRGATAGGVLDRNGVDTGFSHVMPSPLAKCGDSSPPCTSPYNPKLLPYFIPGNLYVNPARGTLTITSTDGDNVLAVDDQDNALAVPIDASRPFTLSVRILPATAGNVPDKDFESAGLFWGKDASSYIKVVFGHNCDTIAAPCLGIQLGSELGGTWNGGVENPPLPAVPFTKSLDLFLAGAPGSPTDPNDNTATASYSVDGGPLTVIETRSSIPDDLFAKTGVYGGLLTTHTPYTPSPDGGNSFSTELEFFRLAR